MRSGWPSGPAGEFRIGSNGTDRTSLKRAPQTINALAEADVPHPEDERQAYTAVRAEKEGGAETPPIIVPPPGAPEAGLLLQQLKIVR